MPIVVRVEIKETDFGQDFEVEPEITVVELCQRICDENGIALRTKSGRPVAWFADGPDIREGKEDERIELIRTQNLERISTYLLARVGDAKPLFTLRFDIPGAGETLLEKRDRERRAEIEERLQTRQVERMQTEEEAKTKRIEALGEAEDFSKVPGDSGAMSQDWVKHGMASVKLKAVDGPGPDASSAVKAPSGATPSSRGMSATDSGRTSQGSGPGGAESRIRRGGAPSSGPRGASGDGEEDEAPTIRAQTFDETIPIESQAHSKSDDGKARGTGKKGAKGKGKQEAKKPPWIAIGAGAGGVLLLGLFIAVVSSGDPEPEVVAATPAPVAPMDLPAATPAPTPAPAPVEAKGPTYELFWSAQEITEFNAEQLSAQMTSFAKTKVKVSWKAQSDAPGATHGLSLAGRFDLRVSELGGSFDVSGAHGAPPVPIGSATSMEVRFDGESAAARVGSRGLGPYPAVDSGGFPRFRFTVPGGVVLTNVRAWEIIPEATPSTP